MQYSQIPVKMPVAWGASAGGSYITPVPIPSQIGISNGRASFTDGFVPLNFLPVGAGGTPPFGQDMNGILNQITLWTQWQNAGALTKYDAAFATLVGGYPFGAIVAGTTAGIVWICTADNNMNNPDTGGANWVNLGGQVSTISVGTDSGSANVMTGTVSPVPTAYNDGAVFIIKKVGSPNTGGMTGNIATIGSVPIVMPDGSALPGGAWPGSGMGLFEYNQASTSLILLNPAATAAANGGISVTAEQVIAMNIPGLPTPVASLNTNDLFPVQSLADGHPVQQTIGALLALTVAGSGRILRVTMLTGSGTYTRPSDTSNVIVFVTAGGGGGGGDPSSIGGASGYGGASGGTALGMANISSLSSIAYNCGAGGTGVAGANGNPGAASNFGSIAAANGGAGGWNSAIVSANGALLAPQPGTATIGINLAGNPGNAPSGGGTPIGDIPGNGGASFWGGAGQGQRSPSTSNLNGSPGNNGGGGGGGDHQAGHDAAGGAGGNGCILLIELS